MKQRSCCSRNGSLIVFYNYLLMFVGRGGTLVESMPLDRKVVGSNPVLAPRQESWASTSLTVACSASACKLRHSSNCCGRERLWVVVDLKRRYRNIQNEWINIIFPLSVVYGIMGEGLVFMYEFMHACMNVGLYISLYMYVAVQCCACTYVCTSGEWLYQCQNGNKIVDL